MAISSVNEIWNGRTSSAEAGGQGGSGVNRTYTRVFRVITDDAELEAQNVMLAPGIPVLTEPYKTTTERDEACLCRSINASHEQDDWKVWQVVCEYSSASDAGDPAKEISKSSGRGGTGEAGAKDSGKESKPTDAPAKFSVTFEKYLKVIRQDVLGNAIQNSAREPLDPPAEVEELRPVITIEQKVAEFDPAAPENRSVVNNGAVMTKIGLFAHGTLRQVGINYEEGFENGRVFFTVTRTFHYNPRGWKTILLDYGFRELQADGSTKLITKKDDKGVERPVSQMVPLRLGQQAVKPDELTFEFYNGVSFGKLGFPTAPRPRKIRFRDDVRQQAERPSLKKKLN